MAEEKIKCSLCGEEAIITGYGDHENLRFVDCKRCGTYSIREMARGYLNDKSNKGKLIISNWLRRTRTKGYFELTYENIEEILKNNSFSSPIEQYNKLILWLGDHADSLGSIIRVNSYDVLAFMNAEKIQDLGALLIELRNDAFVVLYKENAEYFFIQEKFSDFSVRMEMKGWQKYEELKKSNIDSKLAFMAMQFDNDDLSDLFEKRIKKAVNDTGFAIRKLDEERRAGLIDDKLRVEIRRSRFMIADLSDNNNGAYWEAGFAEGLGMPVIYICEESKFQGLHFDTNHHLTVKWNKDKQDEFVEELKATIRATLPEEAVMEDLE